MATVVPSVPELPPAPQRQMSSSTYPVVADTWAAAINPWTLKVNLFGTWMGQQIDGIAISKQAAQQAAAAAADSASAANSSKNAAAAQVGLAADQVQLAAEQVVLANAARNSAEVLAAAAQAAAGAPSLLGNAYKVLRVNAAGTAVAWTSEQQIGDLLSTARNPGAPYLPANGTIYLQSAYPELFAKVGLLGNPAGSVWTYTSVAVTTYALGIDTDGNGVWVRGGKRSVDNGVTWNAIGGTYGASLDTCRAVRYGGNGVWMAATETAIFKSLDNGVTWTSSLTSVGATESPQLITDGAGTWIFIGYSNVFRISKDNGATWGSSIGPTIGSPQGVCYIGNNTWITSSGYRSVNGAVNWSLYGTALGNPLANAGMIYLGNNIILSLSSGSMRRSVDGGFSWSNVGAIGYAVAGSSISHDGKGGLVAVGGTNYLLSSDYGISWQTLAQPSGAGGMAYGSYGQGKFIISTVNGYTVSSETFDYDKLTQFKTPSPVKVQGVAHYIKAKELV